jgi:hypothetical protein
MARLRQSQEEKLSPQVGKKKKNTRRKKRKNKGAINVSNAPCNTTLQNNDTTQTPLPEKLSKKPAFVFMIIRDVRVAALPRRAALMSATASSRCSPHGTRSLRSASIASPHSSALRAVVAAALSLPPSCPRSHSSITAK